MIFIGIVVAFILLGFLIGILIDFVIFFENYQVDMPHIDFKTFHSWYVLNPSRYKLGQKYAYVNVKGWDKPIGFTNYIEYVKYRNFAENKKLESDVAKSNKSMVEILDTVQSDIDSVRASVSPTSSAPAPSATEEISNILSVMEQ